MNRALTSVVLLAFVVCSSAQDLDRYADRDLRKLNTNEVASLRVELKAKTGVELGEKWGFNPLAPWFLAAYDTPKTAWVLVEASPNYLKPDLSGMKAHFFDKSWASVCSFPYPIGSEFILNEVTLQKRHGFDSPLIVAKATWAGPFVSSGRPPPRPAFEQGDVLMQYYALVHTNLFMVRLEDNKGMLVHGSRWRGPGVPAKTKEEWISCLESSSIAEQLSALVWLTRPHLSSQATRMPNHKPESVEDSKLFESVRDDPRTVQSMKRMRGSTNEWVQQYARLRLLRSDNE
jgi:hypothetical protein